MTGRPPAPFAPYAEAIIRAAEAAGIGVSIVAVDDNLPRYLYVSESGAAHLGYPLDELLRLPVMATLALDQLPIVRERLAARLRGEPLPRRYETAVIAKDGRRVPLEVSTSDIDIDGRRVSVAFYFDITERRRAQKALEVSEARFRQLIEAAPEAVWIFDGRRLQFVNPHAVRMLGYEDAAALLAKSPFDLVHPDDRQAVADRTRQMLQEGRSLPPREYRMLAAGGREIMVEVGSIPIQYEGAPALLGFGRDVTERKRMEAQLVQNDRLAALGTLAAGVAHEINNPLTYAFLGLDSALRALAGTDGRAADPAAAAEQIQEARRGVERVAAIVRQLRSFSRVEPEARGPADPREVVASSVRMAMNAIRHRGRLETDLGPVPLVDVDPNRLGQVVLNLLVNAAHALPDGDVTGNRIRAVTRTDEGGRAIVEVSDTGRGIPQDVLPHIFDPFYTTKVPAEGTGLGLFICHGIVTSHGGEIGVDSEPGRGTTFVVRLPPMAARAGATGRTPARPIPGASIARPARSRRRILVVEDEEPLSAMLVQMLGEEHEVTCAPGGGEALGLIAGGAPYDAILCDLMMPGMDGSDLYVAVARQRPGLERRFLFMTGGAFSSRAAAFLAEVPNPRIDKPFGLDQLREALDRVLGAG